MKTRIRVIVGASAVIGVLLFGLVVRQAYRIFREVVFVADNVHMNEPFFKAYDEIGPLAGTVPLDNGFFIELLQKNWKSSDLLVISTQGVHLSAATNWVFSPITPNGATTRYPEVSLRSPKYIIAYRRHPFWSTFTVIYSDFSQDSLPEDKISWLYQRPMDDLSGAKIAAEKEYRAKTEVAAER